MHMNNYELYLRKEIETNDEKIINHFFKFFLNEATSNF